MSNSAPPPLPENSGQATSPVIDQSRQPASCAEDQFDAGKRSLRAFLFPYLTATVLLGAGMLVWHGPQELIYVAVGAAALWFPGRAFIRKRPGKSFVVRLLMMAVALYMLAAIPRELVESYRAGSQGQQVGQATPVSTRRLVTNDRLGFSIELPADWNINENSRPLGGQAGVEMALQGWSRTQSGYMAANVVVAPLPPDGTSLDQLVQSEISALQSMSGSSTRVIGTTRGVLGDRPAIVVETVAANEEPVTRNWAHYVLGPTRTVIVTVSCKEIDASTLRGQLEDVVKSFKTH